jgi:hypothetical protein
MAKKKYEEIISSDWYKEHIKKTPKHLLKGKEGKEKWFKKFCKSKMNTYLYHQRHL